MILPQVILSAIAVFIVVAIAAYGFTTRGYFVHLVLLSTPVLVYLVSHPAIWMMWVIALSKSGLIFPGLPQGLQVLHVLMAGLVVLLLARMAIEKGIHVQFRLSDALLVTFLGLILLTAYMRGFGIRALGDEMWGGMSYIRIFVTGGFLLTAKSLALTEAQLRRALYLMLAFSTLPALAQVVFLASRGTIYQQYLFIEAYVGGLIESLDALEAGRTVRFQMFGNVAGSIVMIAAVLLDRDRLLSRLAFVGLLLLALALAALSGFRGQIIYILAMIGFFTVLGEGRIRWQRLIPLVLAGIAALPLVYLMAPYLPGSMQRAFSWLPMINIPWDVQLEASMSTQTRMRVWEMAWSEVPRYLWIGKGFTVNPADMLSPTVRTNWVLNAFLSHNYHSGPLSLLLDTGILGFVLGTFFLLATCVEMLRRLPDVRGQKLFERAYTFLLAHHLYHVFSFYAIFGDVRESFPQFFIHLAMMFAILNAARAARARPVPAPARPRVISVT